MMKKQTKKASKKTSKKDNSFFYGVTTMSRKGQVVIPKKAREKLEIEDGDELLVIDGGSEGTLVLAKTESVREVMNELAGIVDRQDKNKK